GGVLLSHTPPGAVPSALGSLASGFGMGPGGPSPLSPPTTLSPHTPTRGVGKAACCVVICLQYSRPGLLFQSRIVGAKQGVVKAAADRYRSAPHGTVLPDLACQPSHLLGAFLGSRRWASSSWNSLLASVLPPVIPTERSQPAVPLGGQLAHQRFVRS